MADAKSWPTLVTSKQQPTSTNTRERMSTNDVSYGWGTTFADGNVRRVSMVDIKWYPKLSGSLNSEHPNSSTIELMRCPGCSGLWSRLGQRLTGDGHPSGYEMRRLRCCHQAFTTCLKQPMHCSNHKTQPRFHFRFPGRWQPEGASQVYRPQIPLNQPLKRAYHAPDTLTKYISNQKVYPWVNMFNIDQVHSYVYAHTRLSKEV